MYKICPFCNGQITKKSKQSKQQIYCSDRCRKAANKKAASKNKRVEQRRANMRQNEEVLQLVRQCRRAQTVQILEGHDAISLTITMALVRSRPKFDVNLCHISPVKGKNRTGLFHYKNLFYGGSYQNKKFSNKCLGKGLSIGNEELVEKWAISKKDLTNDILIKIELYLGGAIEEYLKLSSVRKSKKVQVANKICAVDDTECFEELIQTSHTILTEKWAKLSNQKAFKMPERKRESKYINYIDELSRFISYKEAGWSQLKKIRELMIMGYVALSKVPESCTYNENMVKKYSALIKHHSDAKLKTKARWSVLKDIMYDAAFHALQGGTVSVKSLRCTMSKHIKSNELNITK